MIITKVCAEGLLTQLAEEIVGSYDNAKTITNLITDLLAFQNKSVLITKGVIDYPVTTRAVEAENKTILATLLTLQGSVGGYISVDTDRALQWPADIGEDKGQQIRYRKNLKGITKETGYRDLCTRLIPLGTGKLSDVFIDDEVATKSEDATYGYLTLAAEYGCYEGWIGAGEALPDEMEISSGESWVLATSDNADADWKTPEKAWDDNVGSSTYYDKVFNGWSTTFELVFPATNSTKCKCYLTKRLAPETISKVKIEAWWLGAYHDVYEADFTSATWFEVSWAVQSVTKLRFSFYNEASNRGLPQIWEALLFGDDSSETANWVQGSDEHILRADIGDYDNTKDYRVSYTHADYIKAWARIAAGDDLISKALTNKYQTSPESMLEAARLLLTEIKIAPVSYQISTIDLSESEQFSLDFEALQLGSIIQVIDEELSIAVEVRVIKIVHLDLLHPENIEIELSNRTRDLGDTIVNIYKELG